MNNSHRSDGVNCIHVKGGLEKEKWNYLVLRRCRTGALQNYGRGLELARGTVEGQKPRPRRSNETEHKHNFLCILLGH